MFFWPGCDVNIRGITPTHCDKYTRATLIPDFQNSLRQTLSLLRNNSADLIGLYPLLIEFYIDLQIIITYVDFFLITASLFCFCFFFILAMLMVIFFLLATGLLQGCQRKVSGIAKINVLRLA